MSAAAGAIFADRFEIEGPIGSGGMGTILRARDLTSGDRVALKLLSGAAPGAAESERFAREAHILSQLRHPHIVAYVTHGRSEDGQLYLAMEWLDGEDLSQRLRRGALSLHDSVLLLREVAGALAEAHARGIVHRDLKPQNLFLPGGRVADVKLLDFGIARPMTAAQAMTRTGALLGTPQYMAPEQARGSRELTPAVDIFALGCVLYECLAGSPPFVGEHLAAVLMKILLEEPPPLGERRAAVPRELGALMGRMLAKHPLARPADAAALLRELGALAPLPPEEAAPVTAALAPVFAGSEQGLFCVVVAAAAGGGESAPGATAAPAELEAEVARRARLSTALSRMGAAAEFLVDGSLVVTTREAASATDQAVQAAQVALLIKAHWPAAKVALTTGRGVLHGQRPVGEVVDRALRLLGAHGAGSGERSGVWVDELSAQLLDGRFLCEREGEDRRLLVEAQSVDESRPLLGRPVPCIGREQELGVLEALLTGCIEEPRAQAALITAPPGFGKTRLRREFMRRLSGRGEASTVLLAQADPLTEGSPYGLLRQALLRLCDLRGNEADEVRRARLQRRLGQHLPGAGRRRAVALLGELCDVRFDDEGDALLRAARRDPQLLSEHMSASLAELLRAESQAAPVVVVLEDLQWGDALSVRLLDLVLQELGDAPLLVLALARPEVEERFPALWRGRSLQRLSLSALSRRSCERLVRHVLEQAPGAVAAEEVVARLVEQSAGSPLYLEELIRAVAEGKGEDLPPTVAAMLHARLSRLPAAARQVLHAASLFGQTFWRGGVARVLAQEPGAQEVEAGIASLVASEVIEAHRRSRLRGEAEYGFRHGLMREAAYGLLTEADRRAGHRLAGAYLEAAGEPDALVLIDHYQRAQEPERTLPFYLRAAEAAERIGAYPEIRRHYLGALAVLSSLADRPERRRLRAQALLGLLRVSAFTDPPEASLRRLDEAEADLFGAVGADAEPAAPGPSRLQLGMIHFLRGRIYYLAGRHGEAFESAAAARSVAEELGHPELRALGAMSQGHVRGLQGWAPEAEAHLLASTRFFSEAQRYDYWNRAQTFYGHVLALQGRVQAGLDELRQAEALATSIGHPVLLLVVALIRGMLRFFIGDWPAAIADEEATTQLSERTEILTLRFAGLVVLAWAEVRLGRLAAARAHLDQADEMMASMGGRLTVFDFLLCAKAEALLLAGSVPEAVRLADEARALEHPLSRGIAERVRALALSRLGGDAPDRTEIDSAMQRSLDALSSGNLRVEMARTCLEWALLQRRFGDVDRAQELYECATRDFAAFGCDHALREAREAWARGARAAEDRAQG